MDQNGPLQDLVHFGLAHAKIRFGIRSFDQNGRLDHFGPFWSSTLSGRTVATPWKSIAAGPLSSTEREKKVGFPEALRGLFS